jgi:hypothetical protein
MVTTADGEPARYAQIQIVRVSTEEQTFTGLADAEGHFEVGGQEAGDTSSVREWLQKQATPNGNRVFTTPACPIEIERRQLSFARVSGVPTSKSNCHSAPRFRDCCNQASRLIPGNGTGAARLPAGKSRLGCSLLRNPTSIAIAWGEPVCGCNLHPLKSSAFSRRTVTTSVIMG